MPKRRSEDKIIRYKRKLKRLENKLNKVRHRMIDSSDSKEHSEPEPQLIEPSLPPENVTVEDPEEIAVLPPGEVPPEEDCTQLDADILCALRETTEESPKFGEKIHDNLARLWTPILRKGLSKESKDKLTKQFLIPENCTLLQAPKLNPEILAAVSEPCRTKDKRVESVQQQLGLGITAMNRTLVLLLDGDNKRLEAIKLLSDSCRILCDLHHLETEARKKFITPGLDKCFLSIVQDVDRDETLFGSKLSEKIKASRVIEKQGLQIKKVVSTQRPSTKFIPQPSTSRPRYQVNWMGPPRYQPNRGGRGGSRKTNPAGASYRRAPPSNQTKPSNKTSRAPQQH